MPSQPLYSYQRCLIGPEGQILLPSVWFLVIKPGWKVIFRWNDAQRNVSEETVAYRQAEVAKQQAAEKQENGDEDPGTRIREQVLQAREREVQAREREAQTKEQEIQAREQKHVTARSGKLKKFFV